MPEHDGAKVRTRLPRAPPPPPVVPAPPLHDDFLPYETHRGRVVHRQRQWNALHDFLNAAKVHDRNFWDKIREITDPKPREPEISLEQLTAELKTRMNAPELVPSEIDESALRTAEMEAKAIPPKTLDRSTTSSFSRPFSLSEIAWTKLRARDKPSNSAKGFDTVSYHFAQRIPNEHLLELFNACVSSCDVPNLWLTTILIGVLKPGKPSKEPNSYRLIGLESCLLKMLTLLVDRRLREWMEVGNLLPDSQNGFRPGYHGMNNPFLLRCAIDHAAANQSPLYCVFPDLTNAFPWTEQSMLWSYLYRDGASGPIYDWIRMLYRRMEYFVKMSGEGSDNFTSNIGVLTGDGLSPGLLIYHMRDLLVRQQPGDVQFNGRAVTNAEQADDGLLMSMVLRSVQAHVEDYSMWARRKALYANIPKSKCMAFGPIDVDPSHLPNITINEKALEWVNEFKYLGIHTSSSHRDVFEPHYDAMAASARKVAHGTFALENYLGTLPVKEGLVIYRARVDPLLTYGCEVAIATSNRNLKKLEAVQLCFLRRLLHLHSRCTRDFLFSETGIIPIAHRRLILALNYLSRLLSLPNGHLAHSAYADSLNIWRQGKPCWLGDLQGALMALSVPVIFNPAQVVTEDAVLNVIADVHQSYKRQIQQTISSSPKGFYLRRKDIMGEGSHRLQPYLRASVPSHRIALTQLVTSCHLFAVERGRWHPDNLLVPRHWRLCRFCLARVEDEAHCLLLCLGSAELVRQRLQFLNDMFGLAPSLRFRPPSASEYLLMILSDSRVTDRVSKYVFDVYNIYSKRPMFVPTVDQLSS